MTKPKAKRHSEAATGRDVERPDSIPVTAAEAARPISVGLFLALFLSVSSAGGGALLYLLHQSYSLEGHLDRVEQTAQRTEDQVKAVLSGMTEIREQRLPELKLGIEQLRLLQPSVHLEPTPASPPPTPTTRSPSAP